MFLCGHAYQHYVCVEGAVLSLLSNLELQVPDIAPQLKQLKERQNAELANPFKAKRLKEKKEAKDVRKVVQHWNPIIPVFSSAHESSAAWPCRKSKLTKRVLRLLRKCRHLLRRCLMILPNTSPKTFCRRQ